jgi:iron complex transport system permease protein
MAENRLRSSKRSFVLFAGIIVLIVAAALLYLYARTYAKAARIGIPMNPTAMSGILGRALPALAAMGVAATLIAVVSLSFQTIAGSRVLTPSMIGFDSVFVGTQTALVFMFGSMSRAFSNPFLNYAITAGVMVLVSMAMFGAILRNNRNNIVFLLMFGMIFSGIIRSGSSYLQVIMDANEFNQVRAATSVTVNNMNASIIFIAIPIMLIVVLTLLMRHRTLNVMALGQDAAKSLGVLYEREVNATLMLISLGMSVATALIGSITFLGLLAVNITREMFATHRHAPLFVGSALMATLALIAGQAVVELLQGAIPASVIIDLVGCSYMFFLILKENKLR